MINKNQQTKLITSVFFTLLLFGIYMNTSIAETEVVISDTITIQNGIDKTDWEYSTFEVISEMSVDMVYHEQIAVDSKSNIHIVWSDNSDIYGSGTNGAIFYKYYERSTDTWTSTQFISNETDYSSQPGIALDSSDNLHVVWRDESGFAGSGTDSDIVYRMWNATSESWSATNIVSWGCNNDSSEPVVVVDQTDRAYVVWMDESDFNGAGTDRDLFMRFKALTSGVWSPVEVVTTSNNGTCYGPSIDIDSLGNLHVVWNDDVDLGYGTDFDIYHQIYYSFTWSWSSPEIVSKISYSSSYTPDIVIDSKDNIHVTWMETEDYNNKGTDPDIVYRRYVQSTSSWDVVEVVSTESTGNCYLYGGGRNIAVDSSDNIHFLWHSNDDYGELGRDVFYKVLYNDVNLWSKRDVISYELSDNSEYPALDIDSADHVYFVWRQEGDFLGEGADGDVFFRKFGGPPQQPFLRPIIPRVTETGNVYLKWEPVPGADNYDIYRSTAFIASVEGMTPIYTNYDNDYAEILTSQDTYYYAIVAENNYGESKPSNCEYITFEMPSLREYAIVGSLLGGLSVIVVVLIGNKKKK